MFLQGLRPVLAGAGVYLLEQLMENERVNEPAPQLLPVDELLGGESLLFSVHPVAS